MAMLVKILIRILIKVEDSDFDRAAMIMTDMGQDDKSTDSYFFWIDND